RHTSFSRDWSSDVCASDLARGADDKVVRLPSGALPDRAGAFEGGEEAVRRERVEGTAARRRLRAGTGVPLDRGDPAEAGMGRHIDRKSGVQGTRDVEPPST